MKLGKQDFVHDSRDLLWKDIRPKGVKVPTIPKPHGGFGMDFPYWRMLGNGPCDDNTIDPSQAAYNGGGDCVICVSLHSLMESAHNAGRPVPQFTCLSALQAYAAAEVAAGGPAYDLQTGANDNGLQLRDGLNYAQNPGFTDAAGANHKIGPYVRLQPGNLTEMWEALWYGEHLSMGVQLQQAQMDQFNSGQQLDYVGGSVDLGGHNELVVGHPVNGSWTGVMWGRRYTMTPRMITATSDECWVWFDPEQISAKTGRDYEGVDAEQLQQYLAAVAAEFPTSS